MCYKSIQLTKDLFYFDLKTTNQSFHKYIWKRISFADLQNNVSSAAHFGMIPYDVILNWTCSINKVLSFYVTRWHTYHISNPNKRRFTTNSSCHNWKLKLCFKIKYLVSNKSEDKKEQWTFFSYSLLLPLTVFYNSICNLFTSNKFLHDLSENILVLSYPLLWTFMWHD